MGALYIHHMRHKFISSDKMEHKTRERCRIAYPCAACKIQRRKCGEKCLLAPYFPPHDPQKFSVAHKVFGAGNIVKILTSIPAEKREDAVSSMVYEATARMHDPVYGCAGAVSQLQQQIINLQSQLAAVQAGLLTTQAELVNTQAYLASLMTGFSSAGEERRIYDVNHNMLQENGSIVSEDVADPFCLWAPLWTA